MFHEKLEHPRQNKLDHDITTVLGSSDPPPGFGFLHPRFYYLEQKRPVPMEPLRVCTYFILFFPFLVFLIAIYIIMLNDWLSRDIVDISTVDQ
jgi:cytochrome b subunit of formate dehydrogenase